MDVKLSSRFSETKSIRSTVNEDPAACCRNGNGNREHEGNENQEIEKSVFGHHPQVIVVEVAEGERSTRRSGLRRSRTV